MNIDTDTCNSRVHTIKCEYPMGAELIIISTIMCNYILCLSSIYRRTFFSKLLYQLSSDRMFSLTLCLYFIAGNSIFHPFHFSGISLFQFFVGTKNSQMYLFNSTCLDAYVRIKTCHFSPVNDIIFPQYVYLVVTVKRAITVFCGV